MSFGITVTVAAMVTALVGVFVPVATVHAQAADTPRRPATTRILCGLQAGSLFNFSLTDACATARTTTPAGTGSPANTGAGGTGKPQTGPSRGGSYVALGDSVAAGDGLPVDPAAPYAPCRQSRQGYPALVARQTGMTLTNLTCSGATVGDLVTAQGVDGPNIPAQLPRAFANGTPAVISLTAGANDVEWNRFIYACYQYDCTADRYDTAARALMLVFRQKLDYALSSIERRSAGTPPQVIVTGYYNPLSRACSAQEPRLTRAEISWLAKQHAALNRSIRSEVREHDFATYVPISFSRHDICSKDSWVQGLDAAAPLHPTAEGQAYIARKVAAAIDR